MTTAATDSLATVPDLRFSPRRLARAWLVAAAVGVLSAVAICEVALNVVNVPSAFRPLSVGPVVMLTILGVSAATLACLALNLVSAKPVEMFRRVAPVALLISFVPDVAIWSSHAYGHTARASTVLPLMLMHIVAAGICIVALPALGTTRAAPTVAPAS